MAAALELETTLSLADLERPGDPYATGTGRERRFCCPFAVCQTYARDRAHQSLSLNTETGWYVCYRCKGRGRLAEKWAEEIQEQRRGPRPPRRPRLATILARRPEPQPGAAASAPQLMPMLARCMPVAGTPGERYLRRRGLPTSLQTAAGVLYASAWYGYPAVVFRLYDQDGHLVAATGRYADDAQQPKTRTVGDAKLGVFATAGTTHATRKVLVEAPIDALSLAAMGVPAIALGGTRFPYWLPGRLWRQPVALALDADAEGDAGAARLVTALAPFARSVERWRPAGAKDWNALLVSGRDDLHRALDGCAGAGWLPEACARCGAPVDRFTAAGTPLCTTHSAGASSLGAPGATSSLAVEGLTDIVLGLAGELDWPRVRTITGQHLGPGEADWRRVVESPDLQEPVRGLLLGALNGALTRRRAGVPRGVWWSEWAATGGRIPGER